MLEKIKEKWDDILLKIKEDHDITDVSYKTWLLPLKPYSVDKDILTILVPNEIFLGYVEKKYGYVLIYTIEELTGEHYSLDFKLKEQIKEKPEEKVLIKSNTNQESQLAIQMANRNSAKTTTWLMPPP